MASHMHDRNTRLNMPSDVMYHWIERIACATRLYRGAVAGNALPNYVESGSLSASTRI